MTLDEAIKHCLEVAEQEECFINYPHSDIVLGDLDIESHKHYAAEQRQLAEWLQELKDRQWVSVNERLPELIDNNFSEDVLIQLKNGEQYVAIFIGEDTENQLEAYWATNDMHRHFDCDDVMYWQPCPKSLRTEVIDNEH